jgi:AraC-like DNA-binding protein
MVMEIIPQALGKLSNVKVILSNGRSSILYKTLDESLIDKEKYIVTALVVYIVRGRQVISNQDGMQILVEEGSLLFLPKDLYMVSDFISDNKDFAAYLFFIEDEIIDKYKSSFNCSPSKENHAESDIHTFKANEQILNYISSFGLVYGASEDTSHHLLELKLLELLNLIAIQDVSYSFLSALAQTKMPSVKRNIAKFMEANYSRNLKVEDYALLTGRSASTFTRDFKRVYDTTPNQWLMNKRLEKAHEILIEKDWSVTDTALEVGYDNISHFIKTYKRKYGLTPKKAKNFA